MKLFTLCLFFLLITNLSVSQVQENPSSVIKQNHFTKEMVFSYGYKNNVPDEQPTTRFEIAYNNEGNIIERKLIHNNKTQTISSFYYDSLNRLIREITCVGTNITKPLVTSNYEYDANGNEISSCDSGYRGSAPPYDTMRLYDVTKKNYNNKNELVEVIEMTGNKFIFYKKKRYEYNTDGSINSIFYYSQDGELIETDSYLFQKNGKNTIFQKNKSGQSKKATENFYNKNKQLVKQISYFDKPFVTENSYNPDGTLFEKRRSSDGNTINLQRHYYRPVGTNLNF